jgi:hypothetical protein
VSPVIDLDSGRPLVERFPSEAPGGRSAPPDADFAMEIQALVSLLAEVVTLATKRAIFPGQWVLIAELALEHESMRVALRSKRTGPEPLDPDTPALTTELIIGQLNQLRDLIGDGRARC